MAKRNRKVKIFESALERVARTLSQKWKVRVVFQAGRCETSGGTIYLPALPDNASKELMDALQGHLDHEVAHVVFTNFKALHKLRRKPKTMTVVNALEDPRIEAKWCKMYPGARVNLRRSSQWSSEKVARKQEMVDPETGQKKEMRPWDGLSDLGKFLHASIILTTNEFDDDHWFLQDVVEPEILTDVKKHASFFEKALDADDTMDLIPIAEELLQKLQEEDEELPEQEYLDPEDVPEDAIRVPAGMMGGSPQQQVMQKQPQAQQGGGADGGQQIVEEEQVMYAEEPDMDDADQGQGQGQQDAQQQMQAGDADADEEDAQGQAQGSPDYNDFDEGDLDADSQMLDRHEQLRDAVKEELIQEDRYLVYTTEGDEIERIRDGSKTEYKRFMQSAQKYIAPMKRKMARSMLSSKESRWEGDKTRGKLNPRRIYQVPMGTSKRVFRQRVTQEDFDTAVLMFVDHSGSMSGSKLDLAAKTAVVLGELLNQLSIPFAVYGFSTGDGYENGRRMSECPQSERSLYSRWGNLWLGEYKNWDDSWSSSGHKMINMRRNGKANTYDGESLKVGAQMLLSRPEKRKIFFWMNDGHPMPNSSDDYDAHNRYAKDCAKEVEKLVELFAIGINTDAVKRFYSNCVQINNIEELPKTCLTELDALIRKGKTYR